MQAIERETCPQAGHDIVTLVTHRQTRAAELLPRIILAKRLLGEVRGLFPGVRGQGSGEVHGAEDLRLSYTAPTGLYCC